jgi:hypothetical protein
MTAGHDFASLTRCDKQVAVQSLEHAEQILRAHHWCSSSACRARKSALASWMR